MDAEERRYRVKWSIITVGSALVVIVASYSFLFLAWSTTD
jgi:hypothetical protein